MSTDTLSTPISSASDSLRVELVARCDHCDWSALHRADSLVECATFLQALFLAHGTAAHPGASPIGAYLCDARKEAGRAPK